jgi:hypothetical protein
VLLFIFSIGIAGCGGFAFKGTPVSSVSAEQSPGLPAIGEEQKKRSLERQEAQNNALEIGKYQPGPAPMWGLRDIIHPSPVPFILGQPLFAESTRREPVGLTAEGNGHSPLNGQDEKEGIAKQEGSSPGNGREGKPGFSGGAPADIDREKSNPDKDSKTLASSVGSREEGKDLLSEGPRPLTIDADSIALNVRGISPGASVANPSSPALENFPSLVHTRVEDYIDFFQNRAGGFFARALGRSTTYADMMKRIFREKNLPEELFYLALIESGFDPRAFSRAKASGIWQFIGGTAKRFGLKVDKWVDERRDPEKATYAAAEYLKNLHILFNDWDLAAASYNAGEGRILKAMKKANSQDFWKISQQRSVKKETKEYVPMFLAAVTIAQSPQKYGFQNIEYSPPLVYEKVTVPPSTSLVVIAKASEEDLSAIQALNPALKKGKTPPHSSFDIKLPQGKKEIFERNFPSLSKMSVKNKKHRVRKGENLVNIAQKYRLTLLELCDMNDLAPKDRVKPGTTLLLPPA